MPRRIWLLLLVTLLSISASQSKLYYETKQFSRISDMQYFMTSSAEIRMKENLSSKVDVEIVDPYCPVGTLDGKACKEVSSKKKNEPCPSDSVSVLNMCVRFHNTRCPHKYTSVNGKCMLDRGCDLQKYDQIGRKCYEKCPSGYRRYYSNLCISERPSCPLQFRTNGTNNCILSECPVELKQSADEKYCENACPKFFNKTISNLCESEQTVCPENFEKTGNFCVQKKCKYGVLLNGFCLHTICPTGYEFTGKVCRKCSQDTRTICSVYDWKCPMGLIELGSGPNMQCVMICPKKYAQFGKFCYDISVTGCPTGYLHFEENKCIEESKCVMGYAIFGKECVKESTYVEFVFLSRKKLTCPADHVEYKGSCLKMTGHLCPEGMLALEDSNYCVSSCPRQFTQVYKICVANNNCKTHEFSFMGHCYEKCPFGTKNTNDTKTCQVLSNCRSGQVFDLTSFRCTDLSACLRDSFVSPDNRFCHRKDQCNGQGYILDQYCITSCPIDYEVDAQFCKRKPLRCPSLVLVNGTCVSQCPEGQTPVNRVCQKAEISKNNSMCGVNKELQYCEGVKDCKRCVCKPGFIEEKGEDFCVPKDISCPQKHILDLIFILDGSSAIDEYRFNEIKLFLLKTVTQVYSSKINVRVGIIMFGPPEISIIFLEKTERLCDVLKLIQKITYIHGRTYTTLIDAFKIARTIVLSQYNGARIGSTRQVFVISRLVEMINKRTDLLSEIDLQKEQGHRLVFMTIGYEADIPSSIYHFKIKSMKDLSQYLDKVYQITCKDISCAKGYQKIGDQCIDINECDSQACHNNSKCINTPGSFECFCSNNEYYSGIKNGCGKFVDKCSQVEKVITVCDAVTCKSPAKCTNNNGMDFCVCPKGFTYDLTKGCTDIDECLVNPCLGRSTCRNSYGSFDCLCPTGFIYNIHFGCVDIDECRNRTICSGNGICQNSLGSYRCACHSGYEYIHNRGCIDIDECSRWSKICVGDSVICQNTVGSFRCTCPSGLEYREKGCVDINECLLNNTCPESSTCVNTFGGFNCSCKKGFVFENQTKSCKLDETLNVIQPKADLVFGVDTSDSMKDFMDLVKNMLKNIITDYKLKSLASIKHYFALTTGGKSEAKVIFTKETDKNVLKHTDSIDFMGGNSLLSVGLEKSKKLYLENGSTNSSKLVIFITATKPDSYSQSEIDKIKTEIQEIKRKGRLLIIYVGQNVKSTDWRVIFKEKEIEENVITVGQEFIETIHKLIYQKTDRLIKCPDGFIFLDQVCQMKTKRSVYCKWDEKLYALNSTWTSSCAIYTCTDKGVKVLETNCMGFDGDCYKENEFFPCDLNGKFSWRCKCRIVEYLEKETNVNQQRIDYTIIQFDQNATIANTKLEDKNGKCFLPFKYEGEWYYACTDSKSNSRWCSHNMNYKYNEYSYCASQVTSQCIFDGKIYKEGDKWNVGCNVIICESGKPYITARCQTSNGTCLPLNADNYSCQIGNVNHKSCICLQDSFGYGENNAVKVQIKGEKKKKTEEGNVIEFCEEGITGKRHEIGKSWMTSCFSLHCNKNGITEILDKKCISEDGKCYQAGDLQFFACEIGGKVHEKCQCMMENNELVLIFNEGGKVEKKTIESKGYVKITKK